MKHIHNSKHLVAFFFCYNIIVIPCLLLILSGSVTLWINGFAVDRAGCLYIGNAKDICVFEDGTLIRKLSPCTSRSYVFTITEDNNILLSTSSKVYTMDIEGNLLHTEDDPGADVYNQLSYSKRRFVTSTGDEFKLRNILGWWIIVKNDAQIVWNMGLLSYIVFAAISCCTTGLIIFILRYIGKRI